MNLNKVFLIGNLTRDPEMRTLPSGQPVASFGLATNRIYKKDGKQEKQVEFHNIVAFGRLAEICSQYLTRGKMVFVEGRLVNRNWEAKDGTKKNRTEIIMENMQMGPRMGGYEKPDASPPKADKQAGREEAVEPEAIDTIEYPSEDINPDEIPF
ncbi:MAG: single-stranded DNA-binding protein [bacterium]|nr:single-stranded DNA-binding protein [bacterium]